mmetsp:Transcript_22557/g.53429  ORF Transcript_22557/g.53429 Transcript_22557/m.53429 type:complete len:290 (-) Transcript_22557:698-1567(-)
MRLSGGKQRQRRAMSERGFDGGACELERTRAENSSSSPSRRRTWSGRRSIPTPSPSFDTLGARVCVGWLKFKFLAEIEPIFATLGSISATARGLPCSFSALARAFDRPLPSLCRPVGWASEAIGFSGVLLDSFCGNGNKGSHRLLPEDFEPGSGDSERLSKAEFRTRARWFRTEFELSRRLVVDFCASIKRVEDATCMSEWREPSGPPRRSHGVSVLQSRILPWDPPYSPGRFCSPIVSSRTDGACFEDAARILIFALVAGGIAEASSLYTESKTQGAFTTTTTRTIST